MKFTWKESRYTYDCGDNEDQCKKNWKRPWKCPSNYVQWTEENQFWLPHVNVWQDIALVLSFKNFKAQGTV